MKKREVGPMIGLGVAPGRDLKATQKNKEERQTLAGALVVALTPVIV